MEKGTEKHSSGAMEERPLETQTHPLPDAVEPVICPICREEVEDPANDFVTVPCGHAYHPHCVTEWLHGTHGIHGRNVDCPTCRQPLRYRNCNCPLERSRLVAGADLSLPSAGVNFTGFCPLCIADPGRITRAVQAIHYAPFNAATQTNQINNEDVDEDDEEDEEDEDEDDEDEDVDNYPSEEDEDIEDDEQDNGDDAGAANGASAGNLGHLGVIPGSINAE